SIRSASARRTAWSTVAMNSLGSTSVGCILFSDLATLLLKVLYCEHQRVAARVVDRLQFAFTLTSNNNLGQHKAITILGFHIRQSLVLFCNDRNADGGKLLLDLLNF